MSFLPTAVDPRGGRPSAAGDCPRAAVQRQYHGHRHRSAGRRGPWRDGDALNSDTNVSTEAITNQQGAYTLQQLTPGPYKVTVALSGFKTLTFRSGTNQLRGSGILLHRGTWLDANQIQNIRIGVRFQF